MMRVRRKIGGSSAGAVACLVLAWLAPAAAQMPPRGAAFAAVDQPGKAQQYCFGDTLDKARACALEKCRVANAGTVANPCQVTSACDRSGWSGYIAVRMKAGNFTMSMCGVPSRVGLMVRLKDLCRSYRTRGLEACALETIWTPAGLEEQTNLVWSPRALGPSGRAFR